MNIENTGGRVTPYGPGRRNGKFGGDVAEHGPVTSYKYEFDFDQLPGFDLTDNDMVLKIPAGSLIKEVYLKVKENFTGATAVDAGLEQPDGTAIDLNGLVVGAAATAGNTLVGTGALVGTVTIDEAIVNVALTGTATAGKAELIVRFVAQ